MGRKLNSGKGSHPLKRFGKGILKVIRKPLNFVKDVILSTVCLGGSPLIWTINYFRFMNKELKDTKKPGEGGPGLLFAFEAGVFIGVMPFLTLYLCIVDVDAVITLERTKKSN